MINILIMKTNDIIQTDFNGTMEEAKKYYKNNIVVLSAENTILKVIQFMILNGIKVKRYGKSDFKFNDLDIIINNNRLHNIGALTVYTIENDKIHLFDGANGINILEYFKIAYKKEVAELFENINCKEIVNNIKQWDYVTYKKGELNKNNCSIELKRMHESGIYLIKGGYTYFEGMRKGDFYNNKKAV